MYTVLFNRMIEFYDPSNAENGDKPCASAIFDGTVISFDYISANSVVVTDTDGNLIVIKNIESDENLDLHIFRTKFSKIREVKTSYNRQLDQFEYISGVTLDSKVAIWYCKTISDFDEDLEEIKPNKVVKSKWRLTCLCINNPKDFKPHAKNKLEKNLKDKNLKKKAKVEAAKMDTQKTEKKQLQKKNKRDRKAEAKVLRKL